MRGAFERLLSILCFGVRDLSRAAEEAVWLSNLELVLIAVLGVFGLPESFFDNLSKSASLLSEEKRFELEKSSDEEPSMEMSSLSRRRFSTSS